MIKKTSFHKNCFRLLAIGIAGYLFLSLLFYRSGYIFNVNNATISLIILLLFIIAVVWLGYLIQQLSSEENALGMVEKREIKSSSDVEILANELPKSWIKKRIWQITSIARTKGLISSSTLSRLLENEIRISANMIKYIAGIVIFIGLLGTFLGLIQSVKGLESALQYQKPSISDSPELVDPISTRDNIDELYSSMIGTLGGLEKAFGTSISGIVASIILGLLYIGFKNAERQVINKLEDLSTVIILPHFQRTESDSISRIVAESINRTLPRIVRKATTDLKQSTVNLRRSTKLMESSHETLNGFIHSMQTETNKLVSGNEKLIQWLQTFASTVSLIQDGQLAVNKGINAIEQYLEQKESSFLSTTNELSDTLNQTQTLIKDIGNYIKDKDDRLEAFAQKTNESFNNIETVFSELSKALMELESKLLLFQEEFGNLSNENRSAYMQLSEVNSNLEKSYQALLDFTSSKESSFKEILDGSYNTAQRNIEVLRKLSSKLDNHHSILKNITNTINDFSSKIAKLSRTQKTKAQRKASPAKSETKKPLVQRILGKIRKNKSDA